MKLLILTLLLGSCAHAKYPVYRDHSVPVEDLTSTEKLEQCIFRLIEKDGVKAENASKVCSSIFRRTDG